MNRTSASIGSLLQHTASLMVRQSDQVLLEQLGIGFAQYKILQTLQVSPHLKQQQIALNLGQTEASISRQVKLMIQQGLLESRRNSQNRREHITIATAKGERLHDAAHKVLAKYYAPTFTHLGEKHEAQLAKSLQSLHDVICSQDHTATAHRKSA